MLNSAKLLAVDLPASWMMDKFAPPPPDLTNLDAETKLRILRGEEPSENWSSSNPGMPAQQWWSPTAWIQNWVETSV